MTNYNLDPQNMTTEDNGSLITATRRGKRQVRETDGRFAPTNGKRIAAAKRAKAGAWDEQMELYGDVLFA